MFLRLEISWVFAVSPRYLLLGPKPTRDLLGVNYDETPKGVGVDTDGVARLETSLVIWIAVNRQKAKVYGMTYNIHAPIPCNSYHGILSAKIHPYDAHSGGCWWVSISV